MRREISALQGWQDEINRWREGIGHQVESMLEVCGREKVTCEGGGRQSLDQDLGCKFMMQI